MTSYQLVTWSYQEKMVGEEYAEQNRVGRIREIWVDDHAAFIELWNGMLGYVQDLAEIEHLQQMKPQPRKLLIPKLNPGWLPLGRFLCGFRAQGMPCRRASTTHLAP